MRECEIDGGPTMADIPKRLCLLLPLKGEVPRMEHTVTEGEGILLAVAEKWTTWCCFSVGRID